MRYRSAVRWLDYEGRVLWAGFGELCGADREGAGPTDGGGASPRSEGVENIAGMQEHTSTARTTASTSLRKLLTPIPEYTAG